MYAAIPTKYHKLFFSTTGLEYEDLKFIHISFEKNTTVLYSLSKSVLSRQKKVSKYNSIESTLSTTSNKITSYVTNLLSKHN